MGDTYCYYCNECGHSVTIFVGTGFDPSGKGYNDRLIKDGEFGEHAKRILHEDPDIESEIHSSGYLCSCGNLQNGSYLKIYRKGKRVYSTPCYCMECGRRMVRCGAPKEVRCFRCGEVMEEIEDITEVMWE